MSEDKVREAEQAVIRAAKHLARHPRGDGRQYNKYDHEDLKLKIASLDTAMSPLPSSAELMDVCQGLSAPEVQWAGTYWLRWLASEASIVADDSGLQSKLFDLSDELEGRS